MRFEQHSQNQKHLLCRLTKSAEISGHGLMRNCQLLFLTSFLGTPISSSKTAGTQAKRGPYSQSKRWTVLAEQASDRDPHRRFFSTGFVRHSHNQSLRCRLTKSAEVFRRSLMRACRKVLATILRSTVTSSDTARADAKRGM